MVSVLGFTRMVNNDNAKTTLTTLSTGLETFYTDKDRYPLNMTELTTDGKYLPESYGTAAKADLCYVPQAGAYPQRYVATSKATATDTSFYIQRDQKKAERADFALNKSAPLPADYKAGDPEPKPVTADVADCK